MTNQERCDLFLEKAIASSYTFYYSESLVSSKSSELQSKMEPHTTSSSSQCSPSKYACAKHYSTVKRLFGLKVSILVNRSSPASDAFGYKVLNCCLVRFGSDRMYFNAPEFEM